MAFPEVIDLTTSDPEDSPRKAAIEVLAQFQPHKERTKRQQPWVPSPPNPYDTNNGRFSHGNNVPSHNNNNTVPRTGWSLVHDYGIPQSEWHTTDQNTAYGNSRSDLAQEESLAQLLEKEVRPVEQTGYSNWQNDQRKPDTRFWRNERPQVKNDHNSAGRHPQYDKLPSTETTPMHTSFSPSIDSAAQNSHVYHDHSHSQCQASAGSATRSSKRRASVGNNDFVSEPSKRQHISANSAQHHASNYEQRSAKPLNKTRFIDVTDSVVDERVDVSDGASDYIFSAHDASAHTSAKHPPLRVNTDRNKPKRSLPPARKGQAVSIVPKAKPHTNNYGKPFSTEEDELLKRLKEVDKVSWDEMISYFNGRTIGSLQVRYSTKLRHRDSKTYRSQRHADIVSESGQDSRSQSPDSTARPKRQRKAANPGANGFVKWTDVPALIRGGITKSNKERVSNISIAQNPLAKQDRAFPNSMSRLLRQRELGRGGTRSWAYQTKSMSDELKQHTFRDYDLVYHHHGTSGDVLSVSWSPDGTRFAAGSAAISDNASMQYNMSRNLLLGDIDREELRELAEHHEPRPIVSGSENVNSLHAMRESQDSRLFVTVNSTAFSRDGEKLFTAGKDKKVRVYSVNGPLDEVECRYEIGHKASVDVMSISNDGLVALGCHTPDQSIHVYSCNVSNYQHKISFSPGQGTHESFGILPRTPLPSYPCAVKWGMAPQHKDLLLAAFGNDNGLEDRSIAGATCIWDIQTGQQIPLRTVTHDVFDVAWNPLATSASIAFAVASNPSGIAVNKRMRSVVQCLSPNQDAFRNVITWQCPARDINDVLFCPHDTNLIACGATDGKVYVWDQRFADRSQSPLHVLSHGDSLTVLPDIDRELIDTGVRFLSWGPSSSRLFSASSDGVVKVWNPYRCTQNAEVEGFTAPRHQRSAIMAGAFSNDSRHLLVGTEVGQLNVFSIGRKGHGQPARRLKFHPAPSPMETPEDPYAETKALLSSGEVVLRPCGALPIRQAVQGPNYHGASSLLARDMQQAQEALNIANSKLRLCTTANGQDDTEFEKANAKVGDSWNTLMDCRERMRFHTSRQPQAAAFQQSLLVVEKERSILKSTSPYDLEPCRLDCGYFGTTTENAADSGNSELRIPGFLRLVQKMSKIKIASDDEILDDAVQTTCPICQPFSTSGRKRVQCKECKLKRSGMTATCTLCSGLARRPNDETEKTLCTSCSFGCFRCGKPVYISSEAERISCVNCDLSWEAGALGYELVNESTIKTSLMSITKREAPDEEADLGDDEIEHYASRWEA